MVGHAQTITVNDLIEYKAACYNDSTEVYYRLICDWDCVKVPCDKGSSNLMGDPCPSHWVRRQPTFEGFIAWIEKKYYK